LPCMLEIVFMRMAFFNVFARVVAGDMLVGLKPGLTSWSSHIGKSTSFARDSILCLECAADREPIDIVLAKLDWEFGLRTV
jgi:hypothetical protein